MSGLLRAPLTLSRAYRVWRPQLQRTLTGFLRPDQRETWLRLQLKACGRHVFLKVTRLCAHDPRPPPGLDKAIHPVNENSCFGI